MAKSFLKMCKTTKPFFLIYFLFIIHFYLSAGSHGTTVFGVGVDLIKRVNKIFTAFASRIVMKSIDIHLNCEALINTNTSLEP